MKIVVIVFILFGPGMAYAEQVSEKALARKVLQNVEILLFRGFGMEGLRYSEEILVVRKCTSIMRQNQKFAKEVFAESEKLSNDFFMVRVAANPILELCVSCASFAMKTCSQVETAIEDAREEVK